MAQMQLIQDALTKSDIVYTPDWCACDLIEYFKPSGKMLEPCKGEGAILKYMPTADWCEIREGRDFFAYGKQVDWIITNPPYSMLKEFYEHGISISKNCVFLVPFHTFVRRGTLLNSAWLKGWIKHVRFYGGGQALNFPMGNPIAALHFERGYVGATSWSWYVPNTACSGLALPSAPEEALHKNRSGKRGGSALPANR